jgi:exosortase H (IPTLxxWG-CTERM-specific)
VTPTSESGLQRGSWLANGRVLRLPTGPHYRFVLIFTGVMVAGMVALLVDPVDKHLIVPFTGALTALSATLIDLMGGGAIASGAQLSSAGGCTIFVANGCNGIEASLTLAAAILAFPAPLGRRLAGAAIGIGLVQAINLLRIVSLLYLSCWSARWFEFFHYYLWDAVIMLDCVLIFIVWARRQRPPRPAPH